MYDHVKKLLTRVYWQYKNSPKLIQWLKILPDIAGSTIEGQTEKIQRMLDIDTAEGEQLDICGKIAGLAKRPKITLPPSCENDYVPDSIFRMMIKAKIFKNTGDATIDNIKEGVDYILDTETTILDGLDMTMRVLWRDSAISTALVYLMYEYDLMPRPQGVGMLEPRLVTNIPFGFGPYYANFRAPFYSCHGLLNFSGKILLYFKQELNSLVGEINVSEQDIDISEIEVLLIYKNRVTGIEHKQYTVTNENGWFGEPVDHVNGHYEVTAKASLTTPLCSALNITGNLAIEIIYS